jgi:uncharacterized protein with ATP-grasp and redox domains
MKHINTTVTAKNCFEVDRRCINCQFKSFEQLMDKFNVSNNDRQDFHNFYNLTMAKNASLSMPEIYRILNTEFCRIIDIMDPYVNEKKESNQIALQIYDQLRNEVLHSTNPFGMALKLAIAGNIMDYGASQNFDIYSTIQQVFEADFAIDHSIELEKRIKSAKRILYLGDNAGEIVFDKLFIELIMHPQMTFSVRGGAVLNDVTLQDAQEVGMTKVADVIDNGYDAPSTILSKCSPEFLALYNEADLIISKGHGNFEGLIGEDDPRIFFLLMTKCDVVAELIGVEKGSFVVFNKMLID